MATATGIHPFLRLVYAWYATRCCPSWDDEVEVLTREERLRRARQPGGHRAGVDVVVPLLGRGQRSHARLLSRLAEDFGPAAVEVDGARWTAGRWTPIGTTRSRYAAQR